MSDYKLLIDGALVDGDAEMDVINPATEEVLAKCPRASKAQLDAAVRPRSARSRPGRRRRSPSARPS